MSRRLFLALSGSAMLSVVSSCRTRIPFTNPALPLFSRNERAMLEAVQDHLLPSEPGSPGARDVGTLAYLEAALLGSDIPSEDLPTLRHGLKSLEVLSNTLGVPSVVAASAQQREVILRTFEAGVQGQIWLTLVMGYTLEAYVGDPVYGGNPGGIVWQWLGHTAGFPRPPRSVVDERR